MVVSLVSGNPTIPKMVETKIRLRMFLKENLPQILVGSEL